MIATAASAGVPHTLGYRGMLTDTSGNAVADGEYMLDFKLTNSPNNNIMLWQETN